jgi:hypothetical protein
VRSALPAARKASDLFSSFLSWTNCLSFFEASLLASFQVTLGVI